jgi:hypothetical protein
MALTRMASYTGSSRSNGDHSQPMKISLRPLTVAASLLAVTTILTGCGPEQEEQFSSVISASDARTSQIAPHIHTAGVGGVFFISSLPAGDRHHLHQPRSPQPHHHGEQQAQLGPAAVN